MLMMLDPHVHFHVLPRYGSPREFAGSTWNDASWPTAPNSSVGEKVDDAKAAAIIARIRG